MDNKMTVEQAVNVLTQVAAQFKGTLQEHQVITQAFEVIQKTLEEVKTETKAEEIQEVKE
jgi:hypothetical protein